MSVPTKDQIADLLESIARMLELKGENIFKIRAYTNAARAVETYPGDLAIAAAENRLGDIHGIGRAIADKLTELIVTGSLGYYEKLKAEFPPGIFDLFDLQGLGPKKIKAVWEKLGVTTIAGLETACKDGRVADLAGFGKKTADNILASIQSRAKHSGRFRLGEIAPEAERLLAELRGLPTVLQAAVAGSYRRRKEVVGDLDFIVATTAPAEISEFFVKHDMVESVMAHGATKSSVRLKSGIQADLRVVKNTEYPFALNYFTGSKEHNIVMRQRALARGWTLNEYRLGLLEGSTTEPPPIHEERDLYRALGLDYVEPELREDRGEFTAGERHTLPDLIQIENLRGTFHNHTVASDGRSTLAEMAAAAQDLGLQYLGIADHSKSSFQAHGLDAERLLAQVAEIRELNKTFAGHFKLLAGSEVDIHKDGTLDFPDEVLAQLDYCVVSVHNVFNLSEVEMTKRIIRAIENPYVTMLGHLTGRLLLSREGYAVNHAAVIEAAAATGTIIELNANPRRLDMDWRWWPLAREKGVKCAINPDAHHTTHLQFLHFGIGSARKGWLTRGDVVNTLPLDKIEAVLAAKRPPQKVIWLGVALIVVVSYLLGSIPSGLLISKSQGIDIREHGSKNIGATNVWRTMGKKWGLLAFLCDTFKGWLAVTIGISLATHFGSTIELPHGHSLVTYLPPDYAGIAAALGCILGHNFPIWLRFKGGKGVATSLGVIIGMMPLVSIIIFAVWVVVLKITRYVSVASLVASLSLPIAVVVLLFFGPAQGWAAVHGWGNFYFGVAAAGLVFKRHFPNIKRLIAGTELRFGEPKPAEAAADDARPATEPPQP